MYFDPKYAAPHLVSIVVALGFLFACVRRPALARKLYAGLFTYAALVNGFVCSIAPQSYVDNARFALLELYRDFITGWFAEHVTLLVGGIAASQAAIAVGLMAGGSAARVALVGAIGFFVAIAPLGVGSAFPASLVWAAGAVWLLSASAGRSALEGPMVGDRGARSGAARISVRDVHRPRT